VKKDGEALKDALFTQVLPFTDARLLPIITIGILDIFSHIADDGERVYEGSTTV
jgi:hypothetical protein